MTLERESVPHPSRVDVYQTLEQRLFRRPLQLAVYGQVHVLPRTAFTYDALTDAPPLCVHLELRHPVLTPQIALEAGFQTAHAHGVAQFVDLGIHLRFVGLGGVANQVSRQRPLRILALDTSAQL